MLAVAAPAATATITKANARVRASLSLRDCTNVISTIRRTYPGLLHRGTFSLIGLFSEANVTVLKSQRHSSQKPTSQFSEAFFPGNLFSANSRPARNLKKPFSWNSAGKPIRGHHQPTAVFRPSDTSPKQPDISPEQPQTVRIDHGSVNLSFDFGKKTADLHVQLP